MNQPEQSPAIRTMPLLRFLRLWKIANRLVPFKKHAFGDPDAFLAEYLSRELPESMRDPANVRVGVEYRWIEALGQPRVLGRRTVFMSNPLSVKIKLE